MIGLPWTDLRDGFIAVLGVIVVIKAKLQAMRHKCTTTLHAKPGMLMVYTETRDQQEWQDYPVSHSLFTWWQNRGRIDCITTADSDGQAGASQVSHDVSRLEGDLLLRALATPAVQLDDSIY